MSENQDKHQTVKSEKVQKSHKFDIIALILCFVAAFSVWLFVMNSDKAVSEKKIVVTVNVEEQINKWTEYDIISQSDGTDYTHVNVELTISGTPKALEKYDSEDFEIKVKDLDKIKSVGVRTLQFDDPDMPGNDIELVQMTPGYLGSVFIDVVDRSEVPLYAGFIGSVEDGIKIDENSLKPIEKDGLTNEYKTLEKINIRGPQSIIDTVGSVKVIVDVTGLQKSATSKAKTFEFYDKSGLLIDNNYNYIKVETAEVEVQVRINYENKNVPINVVVQANDKDKYKYDYTISYVDGGDSASIPLTGNSANFPEFLKYTVDAEANMPYTVTLGIPELQQLIIDNSLPKDIALGSNAVAIVITVTKSEITPELPESGGGTNSETLSDPSGEQVTA